MMSSAVIISDMIVDGIKIDIKRKSIKNLHIYVKPPEGDVLVTAPYRTSDAAIRRFIIERIDWIRKSQIKVREQIGAREQRKDHIFLAGGQRLKNDGTYTASELSAILRERITLMLPELEQLTGLHAGRISIRSMKTRWGSCTVKTGDIRINSGLIYYPDDCLRYILLHELLHIRFPNHGRDFKETLSGYMPDWREKRAKLR